MCKCGTTACQRSDTDLLEKCRKTKKIQIHTCHAGLVDVAVPVIFDDEIICYLIFGQMKKEENFEKIEPLIQKLKVRPKINFEELYRNLSFFDESKMQAVVSIAEIVAKHILTEKFLVPKRNSRIEIATEYINLNFSRPLCVDFISKELHISKSSLYEMFHSNFGCTVNEYINSVRIQKACDLLKTTDLPIEEISRQTGFSKASYFTRVFKKTMNVTPLKYRKNKDLKFYEHLKSY